MVVRETYNYYSGNIPITITIETKKDDYVLNYIVTISKISSNTEIILDKIRDELVKKCNGVVEIRPIVGGDMTEQPFFSKYMPKYAKILENSNAMLAHKQGLYFANNPELTTKEKDRIISVFTQ